MEKTIGKCDCLDTYHKENILNTLSKRISEYGTEIANTTEAARELRQKGDIATAELAESSADSFRYFQNELSNTLHVVLAVKDCD